MSYFDKQIVKTKCGEFQEEGNSWLCEYEYKNRDFTLQVSDNMGKPSASQIDLLEKTLPKLSDYESKCRGLFSSIEDHDFSALFLDDKYDFTCVFSWGNGEWGTSFFIDFINDKVVRSYRVSD